MEDKEKFVKKKLLFNKKERKFNFPADVKRRNLKLPHFFFYFLATLGSKESIMKFDALIKFMMKLLWFYWIVKKNLASGWDFLVLSHPGNIFSM